jgi:hypothetical protein
VLGCIYENKRSAINDDANDDETFERRLIAIAQKR